MKRYICFNCRTIAATWGTGHCPKCDVYPLMTRGGLTSLLEEITQVEDDLDKKKQVKGTDDENKH